MNRAVEPLGARLSSTLRDLAAHPGRLFALMLAANALAFPFRAYFHDANLYAFQIQHRLAPERHAEDLFFQFGSQDRYSLFSALAAPLAACVGVPMTFFLLYVVSKVLFLGAVLRLTRALVKDPATAALAALFVAVAPIPFGGHDVFQVNEPFLTPRLPATALVLLALERCLAGRRGLAAVLTVLALPIHPLMAFPGLLIVITCVCWDRLGGKGLLVLVGAGTLSLAALFLYQPLASRLFGTMTTEWRSTVLIANTYNFPLQWDIKDWVRVAAALTAAGLVLRGAAISDPVRRLVQAVAVVGVGGLVFAIVSCYLPYALPLQGQAYRWAWPLEALLIPLGFVLMHRLWVQGTSLAKAGAVAGFAYLNHVPWDSVFVWAPTLIALVVGLAHWRGTAETPRQADWLLRTALLGLATAVLPITLLRYSLFLVAWDDLTLILDGLDNVHTATRHTVPGVWLVVFLPLAAWLLRHHRRLFTPAVATTALGSAVAFLLLPLTWLGPDRCGRFAEDLRFVRSYLEERSGAGAAPTVYWPVMRVHYLWFELEANSYFTFPQQLSGNLFSPGTAAEGRRRALIVRRFEMENFARLERYSPSCQNTRNRLLFAAPGGDPGPPTRADFMVLCADERVDFVVLPHRYEGFHAAENGRVFIYDCRDIRAQLAHFNPEFAEAGSPRPLE